MPLPPPLSQGDHRRNSPGPHGECPAPPSPRWLSGRTGARWFWFEQRALGADRLREQMTAAARSAESRYTPLNHVPLPLSRVVDACALTPQYRDRLARHSQDVHKAVARVASSWTFLRRLLIEQPNTGEAAASSIEAAQLLEAGRDHRDLHTGFLALRDNGYEPVRRENLATAGAGPYLIRVHAGDRSSDDKKPRFLIQVIPGERTDTVDG